MDSFGERGDVNPLIDSVDTAEIRALTFPDRLLYGDFYANGSWILRMGNTRNPEAANLRLSSEQHESLKNADLFIKDSRN